MPTENIRNFSIIAHIDHGKSTLADRFLELTGAVSKRELQTQMLDTLSIERERGITIKAQAVRLNYRSKTGKNYIINLIDTPGHVDFTYEVSRSLAACEGALLVVDAAQGVEAQTLANVYLALENNLDILPVLNKIDLPQSDIPGVKEDINKVIGLDAENASCVSAKEGTGVLELLETVVEKIPPPPDRDNEELRCLVFDSWFDNYQGVIVLVRVFSGRVKRGDKVRFMHSRQEYEVLKLGYNTPSPVEAETMGSGEVGFMICGIKNIREIKIGDTITHQGRQAKEPLAGFKEVQPMVFSGIFPVDSDEYEQLRDALEKLQLNDSAFRYEPDSSQALGFGFRCGFLGLLHMEIIQERLEREYGLSLITTAPSVVYLVKTTDGKEMSVDNPAKLPDPGRILAILEPIILTNIHVSNDHVGAVIKLCEERRGVQKKLDYLTPKRVQIVYELPLNEVVLDFYDKLKTITHGYGSMDYHFLEFRESDLIKMDVLVNEEPVDALSIIINRQKAQVRGRDLCAKLRELIPRQMFDVAIQAAIGAKIIARETVKALRKNVTAKCYGGDITRKRKLLERQKEGKKRMKQVGSVEIPQEAFLSILKVDS
jgi:GTP-binding protein LepA